MSFLFMKAGPDFTLGFCYCLEVQEKFKGSAKPIRVLYRAPFTGEPAFEGNQDDPAKYAGATHYKGRLLSIPNTQNNYLYSVS